MSSSTSKENAVKSRASAVICLGAGPSQLPVIDEIHRNGYQVIAIDQNPEAIGFKDVDHILVLSTFSKDPILRALHDLKKRYDFAGILNRSSGPPVVTAAHIATEFNLPGITPDIASKVLNKSDFISTLIENKLPAPWHQRVTDINEISWERISYPALIKPSLSLEGKRGVYVVKNRAELELNFKFSLRYAHDGVIEVQQFIDGEDIGLIAMLDKGVLRQIALIDELNHFSSDGRLMAQGVAIPSIRPVHIQTAVITQAEQIIHAFGLNSSSSPFLITFRGNDSDGLFPIEVHLDLGGDLIIEELLPASTDFSFLEFALAVMMDNCNTTPVINYSGAVVLLDYARTQKKAGRKSYEVHQSKRREELQSLIQEHTDAHFAS
jgi:hypothetical protein